MAMSQPSMSDPMNQTLGSGGVSPVPGPASAAVPVAVSSKQDDTRMPVAVWLSLAGAVLLLVVIGAFFAWPSAADETPSGAVDGAEHRSAETASEVSGDQAAAQNGSEEKREDAIDEPSGAASGNGTVQQTGEDPAANEVAGSPEPPHRARHRRSHPPLP
jgi:hypothetical protein